MGEPFAHGRERRRDRLSEAYLIASKLGIGDPLALPVAEFDGYLRLINQGDLIRTQGEPDPCRSFVENWMAGGDA